VKRGESQLGEASANLEKGGVSMKQDKPTEPEYVDYTDIFAKPGDEQFFDQMMEEDRKEMDAEKTKRPSASEKKVKSFGGTPETKGTKSTKVSSKVPKQKPSHIVDETDQYLGKSIIITGTKKP
jgi:hypothetical protein